MRGHGDAAITPAKPFADQHLPTRLFDPARATDVSELSSRMLAPSAENLARRGGKGACQNSLATSVVAAHCARGSDLWAW